jgi:hypothetical protein
VLRGFAAEQDADPDFCARRSHPRFYARSAYALRPDGLV